MDQIKRYLRESWEDMVAAFSKHLVVFTVVACAFVAFTALILINAPSLWYIPVGLLVVIFLVRSKHVLALLTVLFAASLSYSLGIYASVNMWAATTWFLSYLLAYAIMLLFTSVFQNGVGIYRLLGVPAILAMIVSMGFVVYTANIYLGSAVAAISYIVFSLISYAISGRIPYLFRSKKELPINVAPYSLTKNINDSAKANDWTMVPFLSKDLTKGHYLVWKDRCYVIEPIYLKEPFQQLSYRKPTIGYLDKKVNFWFLDQIYNRIPRWKSRKADIMLVLLDLNNQASPEGDVILVSQANSVRKIPVGIMSAKYMMSNSPRDAKKVNGFLERMDDIFYGNPADIISSLTDQQKAALDDLSGESNKVFLDKPETKTQEK